MQHKHFTFCPSLLCNQTGYNNDLGIKKQCPIKYYANVYIKKNVKFIERKQELSRRQP